jgi:site-specific recombinase
MPLTDGTTQQLAHTGTSGQLPSVIPGELLEVIEAFCAADTPRKRHASFALVVRWTRTRQSKAAEPPRLLVLVQFLESNAELRGRVQQSFGLMLAELDCLSLFAEAGLPSIHPFTTEVVQRLVARLVPSAREDSDTRKLLIELYSTGRNARQFEAMMPDFFEHIAKVLTPADNPGFWQRQERDLEEAMRLLASEISGLGLQPEMRERSTASGIAHSPFYELVLTTEELVASSSPVAVTAALDAWKQVVARCRAEMEVVYEHMESAGISVELVFDLKTIQACLVRMESIAKVLTAPDLHEFHAAVQALLVRLIEGNISDKYIWPLLRDNLNLLARKVVDRTGDTGEHYIANSKPEYWQMWRAALGGGLLTVFTAAVKLRIIEAHLPPFVEGFASGTNYAISFILLQIFGLVLATKQPATTAAAFARIIRDNRGPERSSKLTDYVARITSTQLAAAIGNVVAVSVGAVLFEVLWKVIFRESYLPELHAAHVYDTLNPFASGTALFAIETGVVLWLAALAGSWVENAAVYYRLAEAVAQHPATSRWGEAFSRKMSRIVKHNVGGWATSIVLGYLLGFTPVFGGFFGLPLDIRHVTLSSGTLALAAARFGTVTLGNRWFLHAVVGIIVIFVLNLSVSFTIAALVALRAYDVAPREQWTILRSLITGVLRSPLRFIVPAYIEDETAPREAQGEPS